MRSGNETPVKSLPTVVSSNLPIVTFAEDVALSIQPLKAVIVRPFIAQTTNCSDVKCSLNFGLHVRYAIKEWH